jgi:hypothetical protein
MNPEQWSSIIRTLLLAAPGAWLIGKGVLSGEQANQLVSLVVPIVYSAGAALLGWWGVRTHSASAVVAAVNSPSVPHVKAVAASSPSPQVIVTPTGAVIPDPTIQGTP